MNVKKKLAREVERYLDRGRSLGLIDDLAPVEAVKKALPRMTLVELANIHTTLKTQLVNGQKISISFSPKR